jgi:hypothetical protein
MALEKIASLREEYLMGTRVRTSPAWFWIGGDVGLGEGAGDAVELVGDEGEGDAVVGGVFVGVCGCCGLLIQLDLPIW